MEKDPDNRYQSARKLAEDLAQLKNIKSGHGFACN